MGNRDMFYFADYPTLKSYKSLCRDLKDFYFSRRYASDDYEMITREEYEDYLEAFYKLLHELKGIREGS